MVTSPLHECVELGPLQRELAALLDGTRDLGAIVSVLVERAVSGDLAIELDGEHLTEPGELTHVLEESCRVMLDEFSRNGLLLAESALHLA